MEFINIDLLGGVGGVLFGVAAFPMVAKAVRTGSAADVPAKTIWLFSFACLSYFGWLFFKFGVQWPFFFGLMETVSWFTIMVYHYFPRKPQFKDSRAYRLAREKYNMDGPCTAQCYAECEVLCASELKRHCPHANTRGEPSGYATCLDCLFMDEPKPVTFKDIPYAGESPKHDCICTQTPCICLLPFDKTGPALHYNRDNEDHGC